MTEWKSGDRCAVRRANYHFRECYSLGTVTGVTKAYVFVRFIRYSNSEHKFRKGDSALCELTSEIEAEVKRQADSYRITNMHGDEWRNMSGDKLARIVAILEEK